MFNQITKTYPNSREETYIPPLKRSDNKVHFIGSVSSIVFSILVYCCCSVAQSYPTLCTPMDCSMPGFPVFHHFLELAQIHVPWVSDAIQPSHPLSSLLLLPSVFPSIFSQLFASGGQSIGASSSVLPMNSGLISFRIDYFDLLAVQGTLKSLLQHHSSKASILWYVCM